MTLPPWTPFERGVLDLTPEQEAHFATLPPQVREMLANDEIWINSRYQVNVRQHPSFSDPNVRITHLSIKRRDKGVIRDWRELQRIKNELCGTEREACELYPAESRLVDTANQYHLWVLPAGAVFPFGFMDRLVTQGEHHGSRQRPFEHPPEDVGDVRDIHKQE